MTPQSQDAYEALCAADPDAALAALTDPDVPPTLLTFFAEYAGWHLPVAEVVPVLIGLLTHPKPYVREGAILGLAGRLSDAAVVRALEAAADEDVLPELRALAAEMLEDDK